MRADLSLYRVFVAVADEGRIICQENDLKRIYLDDPEKKKK